MCFSASRRRRAESFLYRRVSAPLLRFALRKRCGGLSRFALRKRCGGLSRFALGKSPGAGFRALLWRSPAGHTFALCSGEVHRAAGLSDFALAKSAVRVDFQTLLWKSPSGRWTFGLCSGEVRRRGGLSDFALAKSKPGGRLLRFALGKSTGAVRLSRFALAKRRRATLSRFALAKSPAGPFPALLWESASFVIRAYVVFDRQGGCESLGPHAGDRAPLSREIPTISRVGVSDRPDTQKSRPGGRRRRSHEYESEHAADAD